MATRKKKLVMVLISLSFAVVLASVGGEIILRRLERTRKTVPETMPYLYYQHDRLRYALVRNSDYYGWAHVNGQGFRGHAEVSLKKPDGVLRVMAVGGSTTFETTVSGDDKAWPARLAQHLKEIAPAKNIEVINAGVPGYRNIDNLIRLETDLYRYQPDVIVLYEVHNDIYEAIKSMGSTEAISDTPDELPAVTPWGRWLSRNSLFYQKLGAATKFLKFNRGSKRAASNLEESDARTAETLERGAAEFERTLSAFVAVANGLGIHVAMPEVVNVSGAATLEEKDPSIRRVWEINFPYARPETILRGYARYNDVVRRVAACAASATYIPTEDFGLRGTDWYAPYDPIHSNDNGADRMGQKMAEALLKSGALERKPAHNAQCPINDKPSILSSR